MRKPFLCFVILSMFLLTGCFNYSDMDKIIFTTAVIIDIDTENKPVVYIETFKASRGAQGSSGKGERVVYRSTGKTMFEAMRDANLSSSYKISYAQIKGIIFTRKAAELGIDNFIDIFDRGTETLLNTQVLVFDGDPKSLVKALAKGDYLGIYIYNLFDNVKTTARGVVINLNDFFNKSYMKDSAIVATMIGFKKEQIETKLEISNSSIIKNYRMVDELKRDEDESYNFLINNIQKGSLEVTNPDYKDNFITLEILQNKTDTKIYYDGKTVHVKKIINTRATIAGIQKGFALTKEGLSEVQKNAESNITKNCTKLFQEYKEKNLDIFNICEDFHRNYPRENMENIISKSQLEIEPHVYIEGSTNTLDFK